MSKTQYTIEAYSPGANQRIREFNLQNLQHIELHRADRAKQHAESFAQRLNQQSYLGFTDWQAVSRLITTGIDTIGT